MAASRSRKASDPSSMAAPFIGLTVILVVVFLYLRMPAAIVGWMLLLATSLLEPSVQPTGPKVKGVATPISDRQLRDIKTSAFWKSCRSRLAFPTDLFMPGKKIALSWVIAIGAGLIFAAMPVMPDFVGVKNTAMFGRIQLADVESYDLLSTWGRAVNGICAAWVIAALAAARRGQSGSPVVGLTPIKKMVQERSYLVLLFGGIGIVAGYIIVAAVTANLSKSGYRMDWWALIGGALVGLAIGVYRPLSVDALSRWKMRNAVTAAWQPVWDNAKVDPTPVLEDVQLLDGEGKILTWRVMGAKSSDAIAGELPKSMHSLGHEQTMVTTYAPVMSQGQPQYGASDPQCFRVIMLDAKDAMALDTAAAVGPEQVRAVLEAAMAQVTQQAKAGPIALTDVEKISDPESPAGCWGTRWESLTPDSPSLATIRTSGAIRGGLSRAIGAEVLVDHRNGAIFIGALLDENTVFEDEGMDVTMANLDREDWWKMRWAEGGPSKWKANAPALQAARKGIGVLENKSEIIREVFLVNHGVEVSDYFKCDGSMATAVDSATLFTTTGFANRASARSGDRIASGMTVYYAKHGQSIPPSMDRLAPAARQPTSMSDINPQGWVITAMINRAFDESRMARPEIIKVSCLTKKSSMRHLWKVEVRLHDGNTLSDVRDKTGKIAAILNVPWLRVAGLNDGCVLYAGCLPTTENLTSPDQDLVHLLSMDWEEAFLRAGLVSESGEVPMMKDLVISPTNAAITTLEFKIPPGKITEDRVKTAIPKLRNMTHNNFIVPKTSERGSSFFRLVVSEYDPLPDKVPFDVGMALEMPGNPFASDIENNPVCLNLGTDNPHLMVAGTSGGGKASSLNSLVAVKISDKYPTGWARNGDLEIGEKILTPGGRESAIVSFSPVITEREYEIKLSDGSTSRTGGSHLWKVRTPSTSGARRSSALDGRNRQCAIELSFAARARAVIGAVAPNTYASVDDMAALSGLCGNQIRRVLHPSMSIPMFVPTTKKSARYSTDDVLSYCREHSGHAMSAGILAEVPPGSWMSVREISDLALGRASSRAQRDSTKTLLRYAKPVSVQGFATRSVNSYDVAETMLMVAQWHESRSKAVDAETLMTTTEMINAGLDAASGKKFSIRTASMTGLADADVPVDPYVLGAWLGDGTSSCGHITSAIAELCTDEHGVADQQHMLDRCRDAGYEAVQLPSCPTKTISVQGLTSGLRAAGVLSNKHVPPMYLRAGHEQRLAVLQGLMDTDGRIGEDGGYELALSDEKLATSALELIRTLGIKASRNIRPAEYKDEHGVYVPCKDRHRIKFTTTTSVFRLPRKLARIPTDVRFTQDWRYITEIVDTGVDVPMRCLVMDDVEHLYVIDDMVPTHNSKSVQAMLTSIRLGGDDLVVIDVQKSAADFLYLKEWTIGWATDMETALATVRALYDEVQKRIKFYVSHNVADIRDLPEDIRPNRIIVFVDEFIGLVSVEKNDLDKNSTDPDVVEARELADAMNSMRSSLAGQLAKLLGEARSAGIHLILATQTLSSATLKAIPGGGNVKANLGRGLMGNSGNPERQSALRYPFNCPPMGEYVPKGRGLWEPVSLTGSIMIQVWYAEQPEYRKALEENIDMTPDDRILDIAPFMPRQQDATGIIGDIPDNLRDILGYAKSGSPQEADDIVFTLDDDDTDIVFTLDDDDNSSTAGDGGSDISFSIEPDPVPEQDPADITFTIEPDDDDGSGDGDVSSLMNDLDDLPEDDQDQSLVEPTPLDEFDQGEPETAGDGKPVGYYRRPVVVADDW